MKKKNELILYDWFFSGQKCYNKVYAVDNIGYKSDVIVCNGVKVDTTPPEPEYLFHIDNNLLKNPSIEIHQSSLPINDTNLYDICSVTPDFIPDDWSLTSRSCAIVVSSIKNLARDGRSFLFIRGSVQQEIEGLKLGGLYQVNLYSSQIPLTVATASNKEGFLSVWKSKHVFLLYSKV